jgi:exonuclease V gamma subunit
MIERIASAPMSHVRNTADVLARGLAKDAPKQIDRYTVLQSTSYVRQSDTFIYFYQTSAQLDHSTHKQQLVNGVCSDGILHALMKRGITFQYRYSDPNGSHLLTENVVAADCP